MKNQNHIGPLVGCFVSLMLYVLLFFWDASLELSELRSVLQLSVSAVPAFCLQLYKGNAQYGLYGGHSEAFD